MLTYQQFKNS